MSLAAVCDLCGRKLESGDVSVCDLCGRSYCPDCDGNGSCDDCEIVYSENLQEERDGESGESQD